MEKNRSLATGRMAHGQFQSAVYFARKHLIKTIILLGRRLWEALPGKKSASEQQTSNRLNWFIQRRSCSELKSEMEEST